jgi:hypothetical protein
MLSEALSFLYGRVDDGSLDNWRPLEINRTRQKKKLSSFVVPWFVTLIGKRSSCFRQTAFMEIKRVNKTPMNMIAEEVCRVRLHLL